MAAKKHKNKHKHKDKHKDDAGAKPDPAAKMRRKEYVERQRRAGVILSPWRGALYKQPDGTIVGIPYASDQRRKNFWFLGLPKDKFSEAVLLCEADGTTLVEVSLPPAFFAKYGSQLGASQAGQRHFQVERRSGDVYVRVPSVGPANVSAYVREYPIN